MAASEPEWLPFPDAHHRLGQVARIESSDCAFVCAKIFGAESYGFRPHRSLVEIFPGSSRKHDLDPVIIKPRQLNQVSEPLSRAQRFPCPDVDLTTTAHGAAGVPLARLGDVMSKISRGA